MTVVVMWKSKVQCQNIGLVGLTSVHHLAGISMLS
jgi:hypothetical protein